MRFPILFAMLADGSGEERPAGALKAAQDLAQQLDGEFSAVICALMISVPSIFVTGTVRGLVAAEKTRTQDAAAAVRRMIDAVAASAGTVIHAEIIEDNLADLGRRLASRARVHGLAAIESPAPGDFAQTALAESLLFESARPVLVLPRGRETLPPLTRAVIAWDGSEGAARAVWGALPLLRLASAIEIVTVEGEKPLAAMPAGASLAPKLAFLGKDTTVTALPFAGGSAGEILLAHARAGKAGFMVMGAYGRSRWSEFILGGVTRDTLRDADLPVLMAQ